MNVAQIAQLAIILAPIAQSIAVEGSNIIATYRADLKQEDINQALELSRSTSWPALDFSQDDGTPL